MEGGDTIRYFTIVVGLCVLISAGYLLICDSSEAIDEEKDITVKVTVPEGVDTGELKRLNVAFVNEDHYVVSHVASDGTCTATLKIGYDYKVTCFNVKRVTTNNVVTFDPVFTDGKGTHMDYVHYGTLHVDSNTSSYTVNMERGEEYTDSDGNLYYTYSSGFATLVRLGVEFEKSSIDLNGTNEEIWRVKSGQVLTIPEKVNGNYEVVFIGANVTPGRSLIYVDESYPTGSNDYLAAMFRGPGTNTLKIVFEGSVILNAQPFTAPHGANTGTTAQDTSYDRYNFDVEFKKDVYVNSFGQYMTSTKQSNLSYCDNSLTGIDTVTIDGVYHGAYSGDKWSAKSKPATGTPVISTGGNGLAYCGISAITLANGITLNETSLGNSTIACLGLLEGNSYSLTPIDGGFGLSIGSTMVEVSAVTNNPDEIGTISNPITFAVVNGNSVTYSLLTKGHAKGTIDEPEALEGMDFAGWYKNSQFTQEYEPDEQLNANTTVYAKYVPKQYTISIFGDGIVVKNGDNAVGNGSKIEFDTTLTLVVENRIGYNAVVKMDGTVIAGNTVKVPTKDFTISCEWVAIDYVVKCMDDETEVKSIENCHIGDVVSLPAMDKAGFAGWSVDKGMLLGAQYVVNYRDAGENYTITLTAVFTDVQNTVWALTVEGEGIQGKVYCTPTNAIGTYGMITVLPGEFERATYAVSANGGYGIISDNCVMVYSIDGKDVTVTVAFQDVGKASEYNVSIAEIASGEKHGFRATVTAENGYVDDAGEFKIRYVYKTWNADENLWIYATSGVTTGVDDEVISIAKGKSSFATGDFLLDKEGATLVFGYASYSFEGTVAGAAGTVTVTSPVIMSVSEIQAVVGRP